MSLASKSSVPISKPEPIPSAHEPAPARRFTFLRVGWLVVTLLLVTLYVVSLPLMYRWQVNLSPQVLELYQQAGISPQWYAIVQIGVSLIAAALYGSLGALIFWKRPDSGFALYISLLLIVLGTMNGTSTIAALGPGWNLVAVALQYLFWLGVLTLPFVFPDGRFVPRWSRWLVPVWAVFLLSAFYVVGFFTGVPLDLRNPNPFTIILFLVTFVGMIALVASWGAAPLYRFRKTTNPIQRQQIKWFAFAIAVSGLGIVLFSIVLPAFNSALLSQSVTGLYYSIITNAAAIVFRFLLGTSITLAVLRYRLWDIDFIINRTLVYVPLTGILAGIFSVVTSVAQSALHFFTGEGTNGLVISTLVIVAVFDPLKKGLQDVVDRTFKEPPDPTKKLRAYGEQVRGVLQVLEMDEMTQRLLKETVAAFDAQGGALYLGQENASQPTKTFGNWTGYAQLSVPLESNGVVVGHLALGERRHNAPYTERHRSILQEQLAPVARAIIWIHAATDDNATSQDKPLLSE